MTKRQPKPLEEGKQPKNWRLQMVNVNARVTRQLETIGRHLENDYRAKGIPISATKLLWRDGYNRSFIITHALEDWALDNNPLDSGAVERWLKGYVDATYVNKEKELGVHLSKMSLEHIKMIDARLRALDMPFLETAWEASNRRAIIALAIERMAEKINAGQ